MLVAWQRVKRLILGVWDDDSQAPSRLMAALVRVMGFFSPSSVAGPQQAVEPRGVILGVF